MLEKKWKQIEEKKIKHKQNYMQRMGKGRKRDYSNNALLSRRTAPPCNSRTFRFDQNHGVAISGDGSFEQVRLRWVL